MNETQSGAKTTTSRTGPSQATRVVAAGLAAGATLALGAGVGTARATPAEAPTPHKSYVCKYVDKPGEAERLQTGQNPIWVDNHSLLGYDGTVTVGQQFKDGQFRSVVIVANTPKLNPEPAVSTCAPPTPPTTPPTKPPTTPPTTPPATPPTKPGHTTTPPTTPSHTTTSHSTTTTGAVVPGSSTYPLQPVKAGVSEEDVVLTPTRDALVLLALLALWVAFGGRVPRLPRLTRPGSPERDS